MDTDARVCREARTLADDGYTVSIVCLRADGPAHVAGVRLIEVPRVPVHRRARLLAEFLSVSARLLVTSGDVYHAHNVHMLPAAWLASRLRGAALVYDSHEIWSEQRPAGRGGRPSAKQRLERWAEMWFAPRADLVLTVSRRYADRIGSAVGVSPLPIPNYPPLPVFERNPLLRELVGAREDEILILYQGGFYPRTRALDVVIDAMHRLPERYRLVLLGFGPDGEEHQLARLVEEEGLSHRVALLPPVSHTSLPRYTSGADIGVIPFRVDSEEMRLASPNKLYEYLGAGLPVLATRAEELVEVLSALGVGEVYEFADADDMARAVYQLGADRERLRERGAAGRKAAEERYCWERVSRSLIEAYARLDHAVDGDRHGH